MGCTSQYCGRPNRTGGFAPPCNASGISRVNWEFPPEFEADYGVPDPEVGHCIETGDGIFERNFTKARVRLTCATGKASITRR